MEMKTTC